MTNRKYGKCYPHRVLGLFIGAAGIGGGVAQVALEVLRTLAETGVHTVALSLLGETKAASSHLWSLRIPYRAYGGDRWRFSMEAFRRAVTFRPDVVYSDHLNLAPVAWVCARICGARLAIFVHSAELWSPQPSEWLVGGRDRWLRWADILMANSCATTQRIRATLRDDSWPISVCHLAPRRLKPPKTVTKWPNPTALMVGRMSSSERYKGHDETLKAWPAVLERVPNARLRIVGSGDDRERLEAMARQPVMQDSITFVGKVSDQNLAIEYGRADLLVLPSTGEGYGLVYGEAALIGIPSIAHREGPAAELIEDGRTGWLVDGRDPTSIGKALGRALSDRDATASLGQVAKQRFESSFTQDQFRRSVLKALSV